MLNSINFTNYMLAKRPDLVRFYFSKKKNLKKMSITYIVAVKLLNSNPTAGGCRSVNMAAALFVRCSGIIRGYLCKKKQLK